MANNNKYNYVTELLIFIFCLFIYLKIPNSDPHF